ncbi:hypothetical protein [Sphingomonas sp. 37zxx]|uniref:hypothetical protein n=1 Tax=Sphingomonas sp. 37zxx TaxID=1550073 RepID=UPI00053BE683|nr:hypothetical protein [Sphingomonas sp. 37zxx]
MITATEFGRLAPNEKAALIYAQAHGDVSSRLWRAALGSGGFSGDEQTQARLADNADLNLDTLLALAGRASAARIAPSPSASPPAAASSAQLPLSPLSSSPVSSSGLPSWSVDEEAVIDTGSRGMPFGGSAMATAASSGAVAGLGANAQFGQALVAAAERTKLPAAVLAAIVDAEAAKTRDGAWQPTSRNPRSSAAGLGQFLGGTWQSEAERPGTWLHDTAVRQGWLGSNGRVLPGAKSALLALRYDATASIHATADYATRSLSHLKQAGIAVGGNLATIAHAAYLGHHLGTADAVRFLTDGLDSGRAKRLLGAQIGSGAADRRIGEASSAASAHRSWLLDFVSRKVQPDRFVNLIPAANG